MLCLCGFVRWLSVCVVAASLVGWVLFSCFVCVCFNSVVVMLFFSYR